MVQHTQIEVLDQNVHSQLRNLDVPTLLQWHMRTGGGQERERDGHTGTRVQTDEVEAGGDATGEPRKQRSGTVSRKRKALLREDPLGRAPSPAVTR